MKKTNGNCDVNGHHDKSLYTWSAKVRGARKRKKEGKEPGILLTDDRIQALDDVGFQLKLYKNCERSDGAFRSNFASEGIQ